jgi:hypothetical protein
MPQSVNTSKLAISHALGGAVRRMTAETIADVDVQLIRTRWRWLHSSWGGNVEAVDRAKSALDALLERRYALMQATAAGPNEAAAA